MLLVISFTILIAMMIAIPFLSNQSRTDAGIQTKLAVLPYIERNTGLVKVSSILAEGSPGQLLSVQVNTKGTLDSVVTADLTGSGCGNICSLINPTGFYSQVDFVWNNNAAIVCTATC